MLRINKNMKDKFIKIQSLIFSLIPEKWENIYLYASVITTEANFPTGELFFYYLPKGILKKKPINVYEVPNRFNINEEQYLNVVKELYDCIKDLKQDFYDTEQDLWTNLTISINNIKFIVEFNYDKLPLNQEENEINRMIWRYKYLGLGGEKKEEQRILDEYFSRKPARKNEFYETGIDSRNEKSRVRFDKDSKDDSIDKIIEKPDIDTEEKEEQRQNRNQILNW